MPPPYAGWAGAQPPPLTALDVKHLRAVGLVVRREGGAGPEGDQHHLGIGGPQSGKVICTWPGTGGQGRDASRPPETWRTAVVCSGVVSWISDAKPC